jgi:hypothetical protein
VMRARDGVLQVSASGLGKRHDMRARALFRGLGWLALQVVLALAFVGPSFVREGAVHIAGVGASVGVLFLAAVHAAQRHRRSAWFEGEHGDSGPGELPQPSGERFRT